MSWIRRSPYKSEKQAQLRMLELLSKQAQTEGQSLTPAEQQLLLGYEEMPDELWQKTSELINRTLETESLNQNLDNPWSFNRALEWAGDLSYPNIVSIAEQVARDTGWLRPPELRGWQRVKDLFQLVGCGLLVVLMMFVVVSIAGFVFHWK